MLERLCDSAGVPAGTAALLSSQLRAAFNGGSSGKPDSGDRPLLAKNIDQMAWIGLSAYTVERLRPLVTLLPVLTPVNLNTAPREVIAALFDGMDLASAERLVQARRAAPLRNTQAAKNYLPTTAVVSNERIGVTSAFFFVRGSLRLDNRLLEERSLVQRIGLDMLVLDRQRLSQVLASGR